jgi:hypothetical protein
MNEAEAALVLAPFKKALKAAGLAVIDVQVIRDLQTERDKALEALRGLVEEYRAEYRVSVVCTDDGEKCSQCKAWAKARAVLEEADNE